MPQPNVNALHINAPLTNIAVGFQLDAEGFIAHKVFPEVPVDHKSDSYWVIPRGDWLRDEARPRADATESVGSGYEVGEDTYNTIVRAIHKDIGDQARANADAPFNLDQNATNFVTQRLLISKEVNFLKKVFKTGVWAHEMNGVAATPGDGEFVQWSDYDDSNPVAVIKALKKKIMRVTGLTPNLLVLGYDVWDALAEHPLFIDRMKYTNASPTSLADVARYFDVERIEISSAVINTGKEGQDDQFDFVLGKVAWLGYVAPTPGMFVPSAGYSFAWKGVSGGLGQTVGVSKFRMDQLKADRVEGEIAVDPKVVSSELGAFLTNVVA